MVVAALDPGSCRQARSVEELPKAAFGTPSLRAPGSD